MVFNEEDAGFAVDVMLRLLLIIAILSLAYFANVGPFFIGTMVLGWGVAAGKLLTIGVGIAIGMLLWVWGAVEKDRYASTRTDTKLERGDDAEQASSGFGE